MKERSVRYLLVALAVVTVVSSAFWFYGIFDGEGGDPRRGVIDSIYASLQIFTLSLDRPPTNTNLPIGLQVTRFIAPILTAGAVWLAVATFARSWIDRRFARRLSEHHVVCGDSSNAYEIARALSGLDARRRVRRRRGGVVVANEVVRPGTSEGLRQAGIRVVQVSPTGPALGAVLNGAASVTIAFESDVETLRWAVAADAQLGERRSAREVSVKAVVAHADPLRRVMGSRIQFINRDDRISHGVLVAEPFVPTASISGIAVVIGDGRGAHYLGRRLRAMGPSHLPQAVTLIGSEGVSHTGDLEHLSYCPVDFDGDPAQIERALSLLNGATEIGQPIYLWSEDSERDISRAFHLATRFDSWSFVVVAPNIRLEHESKSMGSNLRFVDSLDALGQGHILDTDPHEMLRASLEFELLRHGNAQFTETEGPHALDVLTAAGVTLPDVAGQLMVTLERLGIEVVDADEPEFVLAPEEIRLVARQLAELAGQSDDSIIGLAPFAVLAGHIPKIVSQGSLALRPRGEAQQRERIRVGDARRIAPEVGRRYQLRSGGPVNLSPGEASDADIDQVLDFAVKLALADMVMSPDSELWSDLDPEVIEPLAELEHRRWCRNRRERGWRYGPERDNIALLHPDLVPWSALSEHSKDLDRGPVSDVPFVLSSGGLGCAPSPIDSSSRQ